MFIKTCAQKLIPKSRDLKCRPRGTAKMFDISTPTKRQDLHLRDFDHAHIYHCCKQTSVLSPPSGIAHAKLTRNVRTSIGRSVTFNSASLESKGT